MNFLEYYFGEGMLSFIQSKVSSKSKNPKNIHLWQSIENQASKKFGKRSSNTKDDWVRVEYKKRGGTFTEEFDFGIQSSTGYSEIYKNPTIADKTEMIDSNIFASFRGIIDPNGNLYTWVDSGALHEDVLEKLKLTHDYRAVPFYIYPRDKNNIIISYWSRQSISREEKLKYREIVQNNKYLKDFMEEPIRIKEEKI
jgi:hypothetical protein